MRIFICVYTFEVNCCAQSFTSVTHIYSKVIIKSTSSSCSSQWNGIFLHFHMFAVHECKQNATSTPMIVWVFALFIESNTIHIKYFPFTTLYHRILNTVSNSSVGLFVWFLWFFCLHDFVSKRSRCYKFPSHCNVMRCHGDFNWIFLWRTTTTATAATISY